MSHSRIFQVTSVRLNEEEYMNENIDYDEVARSVPLMDYFGESGDSREEDIKWLSGQLPKGFSVDESGVLTYDGSTVFINDWKDELDDALMQMDLYNFDRIAEGRGMCAFYIMDDDHEIRSLWRWAIDIALAYKRNKCEGVETFYVGGILDYHF